MDLATYLRFVLALLFVLGLIFAAAWAARRFGLGGMARLPALRRRRLSVVEMAAVDAKRRLVLVRCDEREHLLLVGGGGDLVIERDVTARFVPEPVELEEDKPS